ncbi:MAG TPA: hypothetical protein PKC18_16325 [Lacipirellulaceae bacterium]|nr:hypothetical protein [Lacipirellulaceae bacterium]HMP05411.1 hypothetical protein [Lacipirellulaceae bacterium]
MLARYLNLILPDQGGQVLPFAERDPEGPTLVTEADCHAQLDRYRGRVPAADIERVAACIPDFCGRYADLTPENVAWQQVAWALSA